MQLDFRQVDVFAGEAFKGNPLAVVIGADGLSDEQMAQIANWTNLSETTFLLQPTAPEADYRVRIFTPQSELPFAGHPTLGTAYVWRSLGGVPKGDKLVQQCAAGLVTLREQGGVFAFAAPPCQRVGGVDAQDVARVALALNIPAQEIVATQWTDNGPGWLSVLLRDRAAVLAVRPNWQAMVGLKLGIVGPWDATTDGADAQFEIRAFVGAEQGYEDPVTGSLNAAVAQWLIKAGIAPASYEARQGTALGRLGRVHITQKGEDIWVGGEVVTRVSGTLTL